MSKPKTSAAQKSAKKYLLVSEDVASDAHLKVAKVKELLADNPDLSINQACKDVGISRSAYYKYRDNVHRYSGKEDMSLFHYQFVLNFSPAFLYSLADVLDKMEVQIQQSSQQKIGLNKSLCNLSCWLNDNAAAKRLLTEFKNIRGVYKCQMQRNSDKV